MGHLWPSWSNFGAILAHLGPTCPSWGYLGPSWSNFGASWGHLCVSWGLLGSVLAFLGAILGHLRTILGYLGPSWPKRCSFTNVVKAYQDFYDHLEVPERGESCLTPARGPPWAILVLDPNGPKNGSHFWSPFGAFLGPKMDPKMAPKLVQNLVNLGFIFGCLFCWVLKLFGCLFRAFLGLPREP